LRRGGKLSKVVDLEEFARTGNTEANPYVQDGDLIYVPRIEKSVIVIGAVYGKREYGLKGLEQTIPRKEFVVPGERTSEGLYELVEGETVLDIIAKVGVAPWADLTNAYIERGSQTTIMVNLADVIADENSRYNIKMENGDKLYVPLINVVVYVEGQVTNPGSYVFQPNLRTSDYIGFAGGPLAEASMSSIYIQRGKEKISASNNLMIEQGDVIFVPKIFLIFWQDYLEISSVLVTILLSYLTIRAVTAP
jgi:protein involved in polysaccharide export with SLBB domain